MRTGELVATVKKLLPTLKRSTRNWWMKCAVSLPGAEIAFKDIVLLNARTEILQLAVKAALFDSWILLAGVSPAPAFTIIKPERDGSHDRYGTSDRQDGGFNVARTKLRIPWLF